MANLIFYYGVMGCSKSANALMTKFQYEERKLHVWLIKPSIDNRSDDSTGRESIVESRVGIKSVATNIFPTDNIRDIMRNYLVDYNKNVIICDEAQFLTAEQIEQLKDIVSLYDISVLCYGLRTDFKTKLFPGSKRLFELSDEIHELDSVCDCGRHAVVNARINKDGKVILKGSQIEIGGNDKYKPLCWKCWKQRISCLK